MYFINISICFQSGPYAASCLGFLFLFSGGGAIPTMLIVVVVVARLVFGGGPDPAMLFFPQALLAGFSFRTGEHKAFAVRKIGGKPDQVPILHKNALGNVLGNLLGNLPSPFFGKKCEHHRYFLFLTF